MFIAQWFALTGCVLATIAQKRQVLYTCAVVPLLHLAGSADIVSFLYLEMHGVHGVSYVVPLCCSKFRSRTALVFRFLSFFVLNFLDFSTFGKVHVEIYYSCSLLPSHPALRRCGTVVCSHQC